MQQVGQPCDPCAVGLVIYRVRLVRRGHGRGSRAQAACNAREGHVIHVLTVQSFAATPAGTGGQQSMQQAREACDPCADGLVMYNYPCIVSDACAQALI